MRWECKTTLSALTNDRAKQPDGEPFSASAVCADGGGTIAAVTCAEPFRLGLVNCTIADNPNGGVLWGSTATEGMPPVVYNSIVWGNGPYEISPDCDDGAFVYYSDVMGGAGCEGFAGNITSNPLFNEYWDPVYGLQGGSDCIDAANPAAAPLTDIDGAYRDSAPDMGAYEYFPDEPDGGE